MAKQALALTLTGDDAERLARLVKAGAYESPEAAVADALAALEESGDPDLDAWLKSVVAARYDALQADPSRGISPDEAKRRLRDSD